MEVPGVRTLEYGRVEDQLPDRSAESSGVLEPAPLVGIWFATDKDAIGVVRVELRQQDGTLFVRVLGVDPEEPVDWGEVEALPYGTSVSATGAIAFTAMFDFGFLVTILAARVSGGILTLDTFNTFTDSSGRSNYFSREFFHR
jgi:hypothetical protein